MNDQSVANRLFMEMCFHSDCELREWYENGFELANTQTPPRPLASATGKTQKEIRGCECDDVRTEVNGLLVQQCFIFRSLSQTPTYQHNSIT